MGEQSNYKLIAFDVDGTLALVNRPLSQSVVDWLIGMESNGIHIVLASGKPSAYLAGLARQIGLNNPTLIGENGSEVTIGHAFPPGNQISIPSELGEEVVSKCLSEVRRSVELRHGDHVWFQPNRSNLTVFPTKELPVSKLAEDMESVLSEQDYSEGIVLYEHADSVELVPKGINKGTALQEVLKTMNISSHDAIAVGDGSNDIPMLDLVGCPIYIGDKGLQDYIAVRNITEAFQFISKKVSGSLEPPPPAGHSIDALDSEYDQICQDWRHRDSMLWGILALSVSVTAAAIGVVVAKDANPTINIAALSAAVMFDLIALIKITKDHYYQCGSAELLLRIKMKKINHLLKQDPEANLRIFSPSGQGKLPYRVKLPRPLAGIYKDISGWSAFKAFYIVMLFLLALAAGLLVYVAATAVGISSYIFG